MKVWELRRALEPYQDETEVTITIAQEQTQIVISEYHAQTLKYIPMQGSSPARTTLLAEFKRVPA